MKINFLKYQSAGNDFIIIDNRIIKFPENTSLISKLCNRRFGIGSDGLILINNDDNVNFFMKYFNSNGKEGSMCGNGARCAVSFSKKIGIINDNTSYFNTIDGKYYAIIKGNQVSLNMKDVFIIQNHSNYIFINTGSPHHIIFINDIDKINVVKNGRSIRYGEPYLNNGVNVDFVQIINKKSLRIRTYERGVEDETLSCGTGITASALAAFYLKKINNTLIKVYSRGGKFLVSFKEFQKKGFKEIWLHGKTSYVFNGFINLIF